MSKKHGHFDNGSTEARSDRHKFERRHEESRKNEGWDPLGEQNSSKNRNPRTQGEIRIVKPKTLNQASLLEAMAKYNMVIAEGPAGTGKTFLAISAAVDAWEEGRVDRIILSRPAIEAGESLGFLPGDLQEKMAPYLRPLYDALNDRIGARKLKQCIFDGVIEIAPIGYMRGRTLNNAFVVIDEAQNCTYVQLKMLLTRLGWHSTMVLTGDPRQSDLLRGMSGLDDIAARLESIEGVVVLHMKDEDIVRHPLVAEMLSVL